MKQRQELINNRPRDVVEAQIKRRLQDPTVYDKGRGFNLGHYVGHWSDERLAIDLAVPRWVVSKVRERHFGMTSRGALAAQARDANKRAESERLEAELRPAPAAVVSLPTPANQQFQTVMAELGELRLQVMAIRATMDELLRVWS